MAQPTSNRINPNPAAGRPQTPQASGTKRSNSTPANAVAQITSQRASALVRKDPPPFSLEHPPTQPTPQPGGRFPSGNPAIQNRPTVAEAVPSRGDPSPAQAIKLSLNDIARQVEVLSNEPPDAQRCAPLARQLLKLFGSAQELRATELLQKAAGLAKRLSGIVARSGEAPDDKARETVDTIAETLHSTLADIERRCVGDWLELQIDSASPTGPGELPGIVLSLDSPQLASDKARTRARKAFDAWIDAHLRDASGLPWRDVVQVLRTVEQKLNWTVSLPQWLRLQTMEARRSQDIGLLSEALGALPHEPADTEALHNLFGLCRTGGLSDEACAELIGLLLPRLPSMAADPAIHDDCLGAVQRIGDADTRQRLLAEHARLHPVPASLRFPRALNGPWRKQHKDLANALAQQWAQAPAHAPTILATVQRLACSPDGNDANTVERQFLLLRDLLSALDPSQRAACLADLMTACKDAIGAARMPASGPWSTSTPPALTGLSSALQALSAIHLDTDISGSRTEALLTEWLVALHVESGDQEQATMLFRRLRMSVHTHVATNYDAGNAPLTGLFRGLFELHGLPGLPSD